MMARTPPPQVVGAARVAVGPGLTSALDGIEDAALQATRAVIRRELEAIEADAEGQWYRQVRKRTGKTGQFNYEERLTGTTLRLSLVPAYPGDTVNGKPRAVYVKRPGPFSLVFVPGAGKVRNPLASDGKSLLTELIRKPGNAAVKRIVRDIGPEVARLSGGGRGR